MYWTRETPVTATEYRTLLALMNDEEIKIAPYTATRLIRRGYATRTVDMGIAISAKGLDYLASIKIPPQPRKAKSPRNTPEYNRDYYHRVTKPKRQATRGK